MEGNDRSHHRRNYEGPMQQASWYSDERQSGLDYTTVLKRFSTLENMGNVKNSASISASGIATSRGIVPS